MFSNLFLYQKYHHVHVCICEDYALYQLTTTKLVELSLKS